MFLCRNCEATMEDEMRFCPECGAKYIVMDRSVYSSEECPIEIIEQFLFVCDNIPKIQLSFRCKTEEAIDACVITIKGKNQFGDEVEDTQQIYADLNGFNGDCFGGNVIIEPKDTNLRNMEVIVSKVAYNNGTIWENKNNEKLEKTSEGYNDIKENSRIIYEELLKQLPQVDNLNAVTMKKIELDDGSHDLLKNESVLKEIEEYEKILIEKLSGFDEFYIPDDVTSIESYMFAFPNDSSKELLIHIPDSVKFIQLNAFRNCKVNKIPDNCSMIKRSAFNSVSFESFIMPKNIEIHDTAFYDCTIPEEYENMSFSGEERVDFWSLSKINGLKKINFVDDKPFLIGTDRLCKKVYELNKIYVDWEHKHVQWKDEVAKYKYQATIVADKKIDCKKFYDLEEINMPSEQSCKKLFIHEKDSDIFKPYFKKDIFLKTVGGALFYKAHLEWKERDNEAERYMATSSHANLMKLSLAGGKIYKELEKKDIQGILLLPPKLEKLYITSDIEQLDLSNHSSDHLKYILLEGNTKLKIDLKDYPNLKMIYSPNGNNVKFKNSKGRIVDLYCENGNSSKTTEGISIIKTEEPFESVLDKYKKIEEYWAEHQDEKEELETEKRAILTNIEKREEQTKKKNNRIEEINNFRLDVEDDLDKAKEEKVQLEKYSLSLGVFQKKLKNETKEKIIKLENTIKELESAVAREREQYNTDASEEIKKIISELDENEKQNESDKKRLKEIEERLSSAGE